MKLQCPLGTVYLPSVFRIENQSLPLLFKFPTPKLRSAPLKLSCLKPKINKANN